jgi:AcrR family transcriptional regulator
MPRPPAHERRARIAGAARGLLAERGVHGWTVEDVARVAGCAKGLVHYHFVTRDGLLVTVLGQVAAERMTRRTGALAAGGTAARDALWRVMRDDAASGLSRAWFEAGLSDDAALQRAMRPSSETVEAFAVNAGAVLVAPPLPSVQARTLLLLLDGLEAALVRGAPENEARDAFDRVWLGMMS